MNIPATASVWRRKDNHNSYIVEAIANENVKSRHQQDFPIIVIFGTKTKTLALTLEKFNELMEEMPTR